MTDSMTDNDKNSLNPAWQQKLWDAVVEYQDRPFRTVSGLPFQYKLKVGKDGSYNRELIVNRRADSKSIVWSSVVLAYSNAMKLKGKIITRPKQLGDIRGISYIYPLLYRFGAIEVPEKYRAVLEGKEGKEQELNLTRP